MGPLGGDLRDRDLLHGVWRSNGVWWCDKECENGKSKTWLWITSCEVMEVAILKGETSEFQHTESNWQQFTHCNSERRDLSSWSVLVTMSERIKVERLDPR
jgi:hypothetical protein